MVLLLILFYGLVESSLFKISNNRTLECPTAAFVFSSDIVDNITAPIIYIERMCTIPNVNVTGSIVISAGEVGCRVARKVLMAQRSGAIAIIIAHRIPPGAHARANEKPTEEPVRIPVLSVHRDCIAGILVSTNTSGTISISPNLWLPIYDHGLFWFGQVLLAFLATAIIIVALVGAFKDIRKTNKITTKVVILVFEALINVVALLVFIDVAHSRGIYSIAVSTFFSVFIQCLIPMTNILMGFFFLEVFSARVSMENFLTTYKVHFTVVTLFCIIGYMIIGIMSILYQISGLILQYASAGIMLPLNLLALILLIIVLLKCYTIDDEYIKKIRVLVLQFVMVCIVITIILLAQLFIYTSPSYPFSYSLRIYAQFDIAFSVILSIYKIYKLVLVHSMKKKFSKKSKSKSNKSKTPNTKTPDHSVQNEDNPKNIPVAL